MSTKNTNKRKEKIFVSEKGKVLLLIFFKIPEFILRFSSFFTIIILKRLGYEPTPDQKHVLFASWSAQRFSLPFGPLFTFLRLLVPLFVQSISDNNTVIYFCQQISTFSEKYFFFFWYGLFLFSARRRLLFIAYSCELIFPRRECTITWKQIENQFVRIIFHDLLSGLFFKWKLSVEKYCLAKCTNICETNSRVLPFSCWIGFQPLSRESNLTDPDRKKYSYEAKILGSRWR